MSSPAQASPWALLEQTTYPAWATSAELKLELKAEANPGSTGAGDGGAVAAAGSGATAATAEDAWRPGKEGRAGVTEGVLETGNGGKEELQEPRGAGGIANREGTALHRLRGNGGPGAAAGAISVGRTGLAELAGMVEVVVGGMGSKEPAGVSAGLPGKAKLLVSEVKGGSAL